MIKIYQKIAKKNININEKDDFLASGGEGSIYLINNLCYKITNHSFKEAKLLELMQLKRENVVTPIDFILNQKNALIGYVLKYIDGEALCRIFSNNFWIDNKIDQNTISNILNNFVETIQYIHDNDCLVVDWNEMNFLVDKSFTTPYFIDTNAWKTKSFSADAITPLFQDHSSDKFNKLTDWYGFGIIACKMFLGIHPFKGTHPAFNRTQEDTILRMKKNISIFNKDTKLPVATRSFDCIPDNYAKWFINIFENGSRVEPPNVAGYITVAKKTVISKFKYFETNLFRTFSSRVHRYYVINDKEIAFCENEILIEQRTISLKDKNKKIGVIISQREKEPYFVFIRNEKLQISNDKGDLVDLDLSAEDFLAHEHIIFVKNRGSMITLVCNDLNGKQIFSIGDSLSIMPKSTKALGNCFYMSVMGNTHFLLPYSTANKFYLRNIRIQELDEYKIIEAKFDLNTLGIIAEREGKYHRFQFIFDAINDSYFMTVENDVSVPILNFVILDNEIGVSMNEDGAINIFRANNKKYSVNSIVDDSIKNTIRLFKNKTTVLFTEGEKVYSLKVVKTSN